MDLKHLRYFVAVAEELHFTRAAHRLNMSQPPLSQMIHRFEAELGFKLFERTKRKVLLTDAGKVLLAESRAIIARADSAVQHAERASRGDVGHLKVAFIPWAEFTTTFSEVFRKFGERHPDVTVDFHSMPSSAALAELSESRIDVAFLATPPDPPRGMNHKLVLSDSLVVALPERHPLTKRRIVPIKLLANLPQIVVAKDRIGSLYQLLDTICRNAGFELRARHVIDHPQTTLALVAAEVGVSLVPGSYENVKRPGIVFRPIRPSARVTMIAAWRPDDKSSVLRAFLDVLEEVRTATNPGRAPR
jgi:DNA-binding transcriptional LysR family regulator